MAHTPADKRPTFRKEERHEFRYHLSVFLAGALSWFCFLLPRPLRYWIAMRLGALFYRGTHTYRENVEANVRQVLGPDRPDAEVCATTRSIFLASAKNFMDLLTLPRYSHRAVLRSTHLTEGDWSILSDVLAEGKGAILVTGHVGCFDYIGHAFIAKGFKLTVVTGRTTSRFIFDGVTWLRGARGSSLMEPTPSGVRGVIRALRRGECAVFLSDRDFFQNGREVTFFGRQTTLPPGPIRIARDTGAPIVPIFTRRIRRGHELRILQPFTVEKTADVDADVKVGLDRLVDALEDGIRETIDQWVMFQRVWPDTPPEPVRVFPVGSPLESELLEKVAAHLPERKTGDAAAWQKAAREADSEGEG